MDDEMNENNKEEDSSLEAYEKPHDMENPAARTRRKYTTARNVVASEEEDHQEMPTIIIPTENIILLDPVDDLDDKPEPIPQRRGIILALVVAVAVVIFLGLSFGPYLYLKQRQETTTGEYYSTIHHDGLSLRGYRRVYEDIYPIS